MIFGKLAGISLVFRLVVAGVLSRSLDRVTFLLYCHAVLTTSFVFPVSLCFCRFCLCIGLFRQPEVDQEPF